jgi:osmotically-inducible protein OsmY
MSIVDMKTPYVGESGSWAIWAWEKGKEAEQLLHYSAYLELRNVNCTYHEGVLTLRGIVPTYYLKQLAQSFVSELEGVIEINNQLKVITSVVHRSPNSDSNNYYEPPRRHPISAK